jgi:AhpD family alkylhydroperoxidase
MARIKGVTGADAGLFTKLAYYFTRKGMKDATGREPEGMLEPLEMFAHLPNLLKAYGKLEQATAKLDALDKRTRALAELKASTVVQCEYCIDLGSAVSRGWGLSDDEMLALPFHKTSPLFGDRDRLVLDFAVAMCSTPVEVSDELVTALKDHFDEAQIVELSYVIALENLRGRFNLALGIGAKGFSEGMVCAVPAPAAVEAAGRAS